MMGRINRNNLLFNLCNIRRHLQAVVKLKVLLFFLASMVVENDLVNEGKVLNVPDIFKGNAEQI